MIDPTISNVSYTISEPRMAAVAGRDWHQSPATSAVIYLLHPSTRGTNEQTKKKQGRHGRNTLTRRQTKERMERMDRMKDEVRRGRPISNHKKPTREKKTGKQINKQKQSNRSTVGARLRIEGAKQEAVGEGLETSSPPISGCLW